MPDLIRLHEFVWRNVSVSIDEPVQMAELFRESQRGLAHEVLKRKGYPMHPDAVELQGLVKSPEYRRELYTFGWMPNRASWCRFESADGVLQEWDRLEPGPDNHPPEFCLRSKMTPVAAWLLPEEVPSRLPDLYSKYRLQGFYGDLAPSWVYREVVR